MIVLYMVFGVVIFIFIFFSVLNWISKKTSNRTKKEVLNFLQDFIDGKDGEWDWDDFISIPINDPYLEQIRRRCAGLREEFPPQNKHSYCGEGGVTVIQAYLDELTKEIPEIPGTELNS